MTSYSLPDFSASIINLTYGIFVYKKNPKALLNKVFGMLMVSICLWQFSEFFLVNSGTVEKAVFWNRFLYFGLIPVPTLAVILAIVAAKPGFFSNRAKLLFICLPAAFLLLLVPTDLFIAGVKKEYWGFGKVAGSYYRYFSVYFSFFILLTLATLYYYLKIAQTAIERIQGKYLFVAVALPGIIGIIILAILQPLNLNYLNITVVPLASIIGNTILAYAIVKHRLMHVDLVLRKGTTYFVLTILIFFPSLALVLWGQKLFFNRVDLLFSLFLSLIFFFGMYFLQKIRPKTEKAVEHLLFKDRYDYRDMLGKFSKVMITILDLQSLTKRVFETITHTMGVEKASLFLWDEEKGAYSLFESKNISVPPTNLQLPKDDPLPSYLHKTGEMIIREELVKGSSIPEQNYIVTMMSLVGAEVSIPLISKGQLIGMLNLGYKFNKDIYSHEDIELLSTLANQTAIALENARLYEDLKRSKSYIRRAERLASLGTLTAGLAHEIRNPLVAIKTLTQLLPDRVDDEEFRDQFFKIASGEVDRISSLVNELLNFAKSSDSKLEFEDINAILDGMILLVSMEIKKKQINILRNYASDLPSVRIDREQIKQVFLNILLNAIQATPENGKITVKTRSFIKAGGEPYIQVECTDTGCGIPPEYIEEIFNPFFTTKTTGTGLGLSISHQIVQDHRGYIDVESQLDKGSSFFINLPVSQDHPKRRRNES